MFPLGLLSAASLSRLGCRISNSFSFSVSAYFRVACASISVFGEERMITDYFFLSMVFGPELLL